MLTIRMQRTGRTGHAQFRVIVQDSHFHPSGGRVVAYVGSYDPHAKTSTLDKDVITKYLSHGAQPSDRVVKLLKKEGVELPAWVKDYTTKERGIKNPDKLRRNRPPEAKEEPATEAEVAADEQPATESEAPAEEVVAETAKPEAPAEETPTEPEVPTEEAPAEESTPEEAPGETTEEPAVDEPAA